MTIRSSPTSCPVLLLLHGDTARRIPHYGRYSYLAFRDGQNRVKATWEPDNSPLQRLFYKDIKR